jgi:hypothetical protein
MSLFNMTRAIGVMAVVIITSPRSRASANNARTIRPRSGPARTAIVTSINV